MNIVIDPDVTGDELRQQIFAGHLVILTRLRSLGDFVEYTREELTSLFCPHDPEHVHEHVEPQMAKILSKWKPVSSTRNGRGNWSAPSSRRRASWPRIRYDLPKPRTSFPVGHLTTGVAFAFPWHRDAWYSAPASRSTGGSRSSGPGRQRHDLRPGQFRPGGAEQLGQLRLLPEQRPPADHGDRGDPRGAGPARSDRPPARPGTRRPPRARPGPAVLRARSCTNRLRTPPGGPGTASTSGRSTRRTWTPGAALRWWTSTAPAPRSGISSTSPTRAASTRRPW